MPDIKTVNVTDQRVEMDDSGIETFCCTLTVILSDDRSHMMDIKSIVPIKDWTYYG